MWANAHAQRAFFDPRQDVAALQTFKVATVQLSFERQVAVAMGAGFQQEHCTHLSFLVWAKRII